MKRRVENGTQAFYELVWGHIERIEATSLIDLGAGRGEWLDGSPSRTQGQRDLRGPGRRVVGLDVDEAVLTNRSLDHGELLGPAGEFPIESDSVDVVVADWVLEHVAEPDVTFREIRRVLRVGGVFLGRTPSRWGYVGVGANLVPNRLHPSMAARLQTGRRSVDVFPTTYRVNTIRDINELAVRHDLDCSIAAVCPSPTYGTNRLLHGLFFLWERIPSDSFATVFHIEMTRRDATSSGP